MRAVRDNSRNGKGSDWGEAVALGLVVECLRHACPDYSEKDFLMQATTEEK